MRALVLAIALSAFIAAPAVACGPPNKGRPHIPPVAAAIDRLLPEVEPDKLKAYPPGSVIVLPGDTPHFHWAKSGEYVCQVTATGPLRLEYLDPRDDPRNKGS